jgi:hypothetical protein
MKKEVGGEGRPLFYLPPNLAVESRERESGRPKARHKSREYSAGWPVIVFEEAI